MKKERQQSKKKTIKDTQRNKRYTSIKTQGHNLNAENTINKDNLFTQ